MAVAMVLPARLPAAAPPDHQQGQPESTVGGADKELTAARRKLDPHLRVAIARRVGSARLPVRATGGRVRIDDKERALVEIHARILTQLARKIERLNGTVVSSSLDYRSIIAWVPVSKLERLASESTVSAIAPAPKFRLVARQGR